MRHVSSRGASTAGSKRIAAAEALCWLHLRCMHHRSWLACMLTTDLGALSSVHCVMAAACSTQPSLSCGSECQPSSILGAVTPASCLRYAASHLQSRMQNVLLAACRCTFNADSIIQDACSRLRLVSPADHYWGAALCGSCSTLSELDLAAPAAP